MSGNATTEASGCVDVKTGEHKQTLPTEQEWVSSVAFSPDGKIIASGGA